MTPAAQYIRMSTDKQDLSPAIQQEAIQSYAEANDLEIVARYKDEGRSGLNLANRPGLKQLLDDVVNGPNFQVVLVFDVSRWGRFQNPDASAYYDYQCGLHGVQVIYVAETFGAELSPMSALVKSMKRVMAAEYSRDLAWKCRAGQQRVLTMGFEMGQLPCIGYRRHSISADGTRRVPLEVGQRKFAFTDRIEWALAPAGEVALVERIFELYATTRCSIRGLARIGVDEGWSNSRGEPISYGMVKSLLRCETFIGNFLWGRSHPQASNRIATGALSRFVGGVPRIVDDSTWALVQAKLSGTGAVPRSRSTLLAELGRAVRRNPHLTSSDLATQSCAHVGTYKRHFGTWTNALHLAGADPALIARNVADRARDKRKRSRAVGNLLAEALRTCGVPAEFNGRYDMLLLTGMDVSVRLIWQKLRGANRLLWCVDRQASKMNTPNMVVVRMNEDETARDFFLVARKDLGSVFPRWLAPDIPAALGSRWCPSVANLAERLGGLCGVAASVPRQLVGFDLNGFSRRPSVQAESR